MELDDRLIAKMDMLVKVPLPYPSILKLIQEGKFPKPRYIGHRVFWKLSEVNTFIDSLPNELESIDRYSGLKGHETRVSAREFNRLQKEADKGTIEKVE